MNQKYRLSPSTIASYFKHRCDRLYRWESVERPDRGRPGIGWNAVSYTHLDVYKRQDLIITAEFSSGPGGQHMQKNATAARVVYKPTGMFVKIQSERSLTQNKRLAMAIIQARLQEVEQDKQSAAVAAERKAQVGSGDRSEKIRTYNYPQSRVTDHRVGFTSYNLPVVMDGDLDPFIDALALADETEKLAAATE